MNKRHAALEMTLLHDNVFEGFFFYFQAFYQTFHFKQSPSHHLKMQNQKVLTLKLLGCEVIALFLTSVLF